MNYLRAAIGLVFIVGIAFLLSGNRKKVDWRLVGIGIAFQLAIGLAIAKVGFVRVVFEFISDKFVTFLSFAREGSSFVFGSLASNTSNTGFIFAFQAMPTVI
ncbi:MAG: Na+ dependent nucleoside transporter N-terminal domain-containing protein, partial [Flammeovirgaceae bacterium]